MVLDLLIWVYLGACCQPSLPPGLPAVCDVCVCVCEQLLSSCW